MSNNKNIVKFKLEGIGPFSNNVNFSFDGEKKDIRLAIYATNGTGKTFISRCFNEFVAKKAREERYYPKMNLISFGISSGKFEVEIQTRDEKDSAGNIIKNGAVSKFKMPVSDTDGTILYSYDDIIYHVFNSDYVKRQFMSRNYMPDGNIEGEITVGEENVKTAVLSEEINVKNVKNEGIKKDIETTISTKKNNLKNDYNIASILSEWKDITFDNIIKGEIECNKNKTDLIDEYAALKSFEEIADIFNDIPKLTSIKTTIDVGIINKGTSDFPI